MKVYVIIEKILKKMIKCFWVLFIKIHEYKNIWKKRNIWKKVKLTEEQKKQIDDFYKENYGKKVKYWWHRLYQSYTGNFDFRYVPEYIFSTRIEPKTNNRLDAMPFENKNMLSVVFDDKNVKIPETYIMCVNGKLFDGNRNLITKEDAGKILKTINNGTYDAVIKATIDTNSGRDVHMISMKNGIDQKSQKDIEKIIDEMGQNFVVQEKIKQHKSLSKLYDKSINTFRVITYILENQIFVAPIVLRIGQGGATVDNAHAGGMFIGVLDDGNLKKEAYTEYQLRYLMHPDTKMVFDKYKIPSIEKIRECAINLHKKIPMLDYVSWDFTIDENENIILIETNLSSQAIWISQMAHGKSFYGDNAAKILRKLKS